MTLQRAALWAIVIVASMYLLVRRAWLLLPARCSVLALCTDRRAGDAFRSARRIGRLDCHGRSTLLAAILVTGGWFGFSAVR